MSGSHTPGPWHWDADPVKGDPTGRIRYQVVATGKTITKIYYSSFEGGATNAESDARLIAAAPDLLVALSDLLAMCERQVDFDDDGDGGMFERCLAAIKKAIGEQS